MQGLHPEAVELAEGVCALFVVGETPHREDVVVPKLS